jgi:cytochrome c551/c552
MKISKILLVLAVAGLAAGCAASGKAIVDQYKSVTPDRFEGAVAVVLEDRQTGKVSDDGVELVAEGFKRIKLMNRKALDCGKDNPNCRLERAVCYNETWDKVEFINVRTITPEGDVIELTIDDMSDRTFTTWAVPDQDQRCYVYQVKGGAPGSIIEEHFRIHSTKILGAGGFWFQDQDPVLEANYTLDTPIDYKYSWKVKNIDIKPTEKKVGNRIMRTWTAKQVSPIIIEEGMIAPDDVVAQLKIANQNVAAFGDYEKCRSIKNWEDMGGCWHQMIAKVQEVTPAIKDVAKKIAAENKTETERVKAVWKYMNENVRYVGLERGLAGFIPLSAHVVCSKKYGDCKAVAGLISVLCREMGIKADPILIGTRPQLGALDQDLPGPFHFNHSIARVEADGKVYWMDATGRYDSFDNTQDRNQGVHVVVASPEKSFIDFIPVQPPDASVSTVTTVFKPQKDGAMEFDFKFSSTGSIASYYRGASYAYTAEKWNKWIESKLAVNYPQISITEQSFTGKEDNEQTFDITVKAKIPRALQPTGRGISFEVKEPFKKTVYELFELPKRRYPVDLGSLGTNKHRYEVLIPEGTKPTGLPKNVMFEDEFLKVERLAQIEDNKVVALHSLAIKKLIIPVDEYQKARKSFLKALDASTFVVIFEPEKGKKVAKEGI